MPRASRAAARRVRRAQAAVLQAPRVLARLRASMGEQTLGLVAAAPGLLAAVVARAA
jgi:hypothetical protein